MFGSGTPHLKAFAIKVLSLTCSASGCERNWSMFEHVSTLKTVQKVYSFTFFCQFLVLELTVILLCVVDLLYNYNVLQIHSKKRNRLEHKKLRDLVYVKYNQALKANASKKKKGDPIRLKNIDECNNEWVLGRMMDAGDEPVFDDEDDGLTWNTVAAAVGVDEPRHNTRASTTKSNVTSSERASTSRGRGGKGKGKARQSNTRFELVDESEEELEIGNESNDTSSGEEDLHIAELDNDGDDDSDNDGGVDGSDGNEMIEYESD